jgi:hypothetical protein
MGAATAKDVIRMPNGQLGYNLRDHAELFTDVYADIKDSPEVRQWLDEIYDTRNGEAMTKLWIDSTIKAAHRNADIRSIAEPHVTAEQLRITLRLMLQAGSFNPLRVAEPVDERPRDARGRYLTEDQVRVREYEEFARTQSSRDCQERARSDRGFGEFYRGSLRQEMASHQIPDAVVPVGQEPKAYDAGPALELFAEAYNRAPSDLVSRPINGAVTLEGVKYPWADFLQLVEAANASRLIR